MVLILLVHLRIRPLLHDVVVPLHSLEQFLASNPSMQTLGQFWDTDYGSSSRSTLVQMNRDYIRVKMI